MTTLLVHVTQVKTARVAEEAAAQIKLTSAVAAATAADKDVEQSLKDLGAKETAITAKRRELEEADTPPQRAALALQLLTLEKERNVIQKTLLDRRAIAAAANEKKDLAEARMKRAATRRSQAEGWLDRVTREGHRRTDLTTAYAGLTAVRADATALKAQQSYTDAQAKLADVRPKLGEAAAARAAWLEKKILEERTIVEQSEDVVDDYLSTNAGKEGEVAPFLRAFQRAEWALAAYVDGLGARFATARATIERLADPNLVLIEAAEAAALALLDVAAKRDAATHEIALNVARGTLAEKARDVARERLKATLDDPTRTPTQVDALPAVDAVLDAQTTFTTNTFTPALNAFTLADRTQLSEWQAAMSPEAWQGLLDLQTANDELDAIETVPAPAFDQALIDAEDDYVDALVEQETMTLATDIGTDARADALAVVDGDATRRSGRFGIFRGIDND